MTASIISVYWLYPKNYAYILQEEEEEEEAAKRRKPN